MKTKVQKKLEFKDWLTKMCTNLPTLYMMGTMIIMIGGFQLEFVIKGLVKNTGD